MSNHICDCVAVFCDQLKKFKRHWEKELQMGTNCKIKIFRDQEITSLIIIVSKKSGGKNSTLKSLNQRTTFFECLTPSFTCINMYNIPSGTSANIF